MLGIKHLAIINYPRLLSIFILFPLFVKCMQKSKSSQSYIDKLFFMLLLVMLLLTLREETVTTSMRESFYIFIGMALPFYVFRNSIVNRNDILKISSAVLVSIIVLMVISFFEMVLSWPFSQHHIASEINLYRSMYGEGLRGGSLRVSSTLGEPLSYAYVLLIWLSTFVFIRQYVFYNKILFIHASSSSGVLCPFCLKKNA